MKINYKTIGISALVIVAVCALGFILETENYALLIALLAISIFIVSGWFYFKKQKKYEKENTNTLIDMYLNKQCYTTEVMNEIKAILAKRKVLEEDIQLRYEETAKDITEFSDDGLIYLYTCQDKVYNWKSELAFQEIMKRNLDLEKINKMKEESHQNYKNANIDFPIICGYVACSGVFLGIMWLFKWADWLHPINSQNLFSSTNIPYLILIALAIFEIIGLCCPFYLLFYRWENINGKIVKFSKNCKKHAGVMLLILLIMIAITLLFVNYFFKI